MSDTPDFVNGQRHRRQGLVVRQFGDGGPDTCLEINRVYTDDQAGRAHVEITIRIDDGTRQTIRLEREEGEAAGRYLSTICGPHTYPTALHDGFGWGASESSTAGW